MGRGCSTVWSSEVHVQGLRAPHSCSAAHPRFCAAQACKTCACTCVCVRASVPVCACVRVPVCVRAPVCQSLKTSGVFWVDRSNENKLSWIDRSNESKLSWIDRSNKNKWSVLG